MRPKLDPRIPLGTDGIAALGSSDGTGYEIDCGAFVLPGLIDMHTDLPPGPEHRAAQPRTWGDYLRRREFVVIPKN